MKRLSGGLNNDVFGDKTFILKQYKNKRFIKGLGYSVRERFNREINALRLYKNKKFYPLFVPSVLSIDKTKNSIVLRRINGMPLEDFIRINLRSFDQQKIANKIADSLKKIHSPKILKQKNLVDYYLNKTHLFISQAKPILDFEHIKLDPLLEWMKKRISLLNKKEPVVRIHADFWLNNIIIDPPNNKLTIIDWEFSDIGSRYEDLGVFYTNVHQHFPTLENFCKIFFNRYSQNLNIEIIKVFGIYRCLRLLSFVDLKIYKSTKSDYPHNFKELIKIIKNNIYPKKNT